MSNIKRPIYRWSMDGRLLETYASAVDAAERLEAAYATVQKWSKLNRIVNGCLITRFSDPMTIAMLLSNKSEGKVEMYEMRPVLVATFGSVSEAAKVTGFPPKKIYDAISGRCLVAKKYQFKKI